jgi:hypothetical protein
LREGNRKEDGWPGDQSRQDRSEAGKRSGIAGEVERMLLGSWGINVHLNREYGREVPDCRSGSSQRICHAFPVHVDLVVPRFIKLAGARTESSAWALHS